MTLKLSRLEVFDADAHTQARVLSRYVRTKTYIKDPSQCVHRHPRRWPFRGQPVLWASERLQLPLNAVNEVAVVSTAGCNLKCWYCFAGDVCEQEGDDVGFVDIEAALRGSNSHVWRISGGEPMLQAEAVGEFVQYANDPGVRVFVVDTNLTQDPAPFLRVMHHYGGGVADDVAVIGCFKGITDFDARLNTGRGQRLTLDDQIRSARRLYEALPNVFFYVADAASVRTMRNPDAALRGFFWRLQEHVGHTAPLRTCFIEMHQYNLGRWKPEQAAPRGVRVNQLRTLWDGLVEANYQAEVLWLPSHQVKTGGL